MLVSQAASPTSGLEAEITTCGNSADSLETTIWFGDATTKVRALHAQSPVDQDLFEQGPPALMAIIAQDYRLTWVDGSHLEISLPPARNWTRDTDSFGGVTVAYRQRSPATDTTPGHD